VPHLVYISGAGADAPSPVPVFESKRAVEEHIRDLDLPATIIAPVYLMENAFNPWNLDALRGGRFPLALPPQRSLQQVAIADVAAFAALAVGRRDELVGRRIEIASDEITGQQAATALTGATGRNFAFAEVPLHSLAPGLRALFAWLDRVGFDLDLASLHGRYPEVAWRSFARWAAEQAWDGRATPRPA
jgi:uncharacterized protein YbjT (DUF2867 family)